MLVLRWDRSRNSSRTVSWRVGLYHSAICAIKIKNKFPKIPNQFTLHLSTRNTAMCTQRSLSISTNDSRHYARFTGAQYEVPVFECCRYVGIWVNCGARTTYTGLLTKLGFDPRANGNELLYNCLRNATVYVCFLILCFLYNQWLLNVFSVCEVPTLKIEWC